MGVIDSYVEIDKPKTSIKMDKRFISSHWGQDEVVWLMNSHAVENQTTPREKMGKRYIGKSEWVKAFPDVYDVRVMKTKRLSKEILPILDIMCPFSKGYRLVKETHVLCYIPEITLNLFDKMVRRYERKHDVNLIKHKLLDKFNENSFYHERVHGHWVLMYAGTDEDEKARGLVTGSSKNTWGQQRAYIRNNYPEYEIPNFKDMLMVILMNYINNKGEKLLEHRYCRTNTLESGYHNYRVHVGFFGREGVAVRSYRDSNRHYNNGVACCLK